jgi:hypothetical protein
VGRGGERGAHVVDVDAQLREVRPDHSGTSQSAGRKVGLGRSSRRGLAEWRGRALH